MKLRFLLPSVIFLFSAFVARGQVSERLYQGFETGETAKFAVTPSSSSSYSTTYFATGSRSLEFKQITNDTAFLVFDTLNLTNTSSRVYVSVDFDHICDVAARIGSAWVCRLLYKRYNEQNWTHLTTLYYDRTEGGTSNFNASASFHRNAYEEWKAGDVSNNTWKHERFNFEVLPSVAASERKYLIRLEIRQSENNTTGIWRLDNFRVRTSLSPMVSPKITMVNYPDAYYYPSSRGANIVLDASSSLGIDPDSVYLYYRAGVNGTPVKLPMSQVAGVSNRFAANIPFFGYDTVMRFYCVVRDISGNANMTTFPRTAGNWVEYACVRGVEQNGVARDPFIGVNSPASSFFPFMNKASGRSEWVYDSASLAAAGYRQGEMVAMRFTLSQYTPAVTRQRFQVKMKNVETNYRVDESLSNHPFTSDYMRVVYDGPMTIMEANADISQTLEFQDTFYYAGKDIVMLVSYFTPDAVPATSIKMCDVAQGRRTFYTLGGDLNENPFGGDMLAGDIYDSRRPALVFTQKANLPLLYDMGFNTVDTSATYGLVRPNFNVPMTPDDHSIQVNLKNYGALPVNAIQISYEIKRDATVVSTGHYNWNGNLDGGAVELVTIATNEQLPAGSYKLKVWVEDTLTAGGQQYRDHEPYNDTVQAEFIVCAGPMNGERHIGGATPDYNSMKDFLLALERCGIDDTLVVKLAPGIYDPFRMPSVNGLSEQNYIMFEPETDGVSFVSRMNGDSIVNLEDVSHIRFHNIKFVRRSGTLANMIKLGRNRTDCRFEGCEFVDSLANPLASELIDAMINTNYANGTIIDSCRFVKGKVGVNVKGISIENLSTNNVVRNSWFSNQTNNAVTVTFQTDVVIEKNEMYDVTSNTSSVLSVSSCRGQSRVWGNKIYTTRGASGVAVSDVIGTSENRFLLANNMIVCNDGGLGNLLRTPVNVISATWADVVYNSVKLIAPQRNNIAAVTFGDGSSNLQHSRFVNNVVVCLDNNNYALEYKPGSRTTDTVGHNVYYTLGSILNKKSGAASMTLTDWALAVPEDTASISVNPNFLNGSLVDLRTYNRLLMGVGIPIASVLTDMFDTVRDIVSTCPGAFEFLSLQYDFAPEALVSPLSENCHMPQQVELVVRLRNSGTSGYRGNGLRLSYQVDNGAVHTVTILDSVPAEDTITIATGAMLQLPPNGTSDVEYSLKVYTLFADDPNQTNDTNVFSVTSKYHPARPNNDSVQIAYSTAATITPTNGVEQWTVYGPTSAPRRKSELYWFYDTTDAVPFFVGNTLTTDTLRRDTTFYFRQKRDKPIVRMTQLEIKRGGSGNNATEGETPDAPSWLVSGRKVALQLTNVGDARAYLAGDTIQTISPTTTPASSNLNNHIFVFPAGVYIEPGESLVVQWATGTSSNPMKTIHTGSTPFTVSYNSKIAFVYRRGGVIEDVIAMNDITASSSHAVSWANANVPSWVWNGTGVNVSANNRTAGLVRTSFSHGNMLDWRIANNTSPMFLNSIDESWIRYTDNGCEGEFASYKVTMEAPPSADIDIAVPVVPNDACRLGMENVLVRVYNYGIEPVNGLTLHYTTIGGIDTVTDTVNQTIAAYGGSLDYTFTGQLNMAFDRDTTLTVKVWADSVGGDIILSNDTNMITVRVPVTPAAPGVAPDDSNVIAMRIVSYAEADTMQLSPMEGLIPVWYDYDGNVVDTGYTNISEILYVGGTRGVSYLVYRPTEGTVGTGTTQNSANYPTPYQPKTKYAKQQYIYSASELRAAGLQAGWIDSIAFNLKAIGGTSAAPVSINEYMISLGSTNDTIFGSNSDWKSTRMVYSRTPMAVLPSEINTWKTHVLDNRYYWDGTSSLVVQIVHKITTANSTIGKSTYTSKQNTVIWKDGSAELTPTTEDFVGAGTLSEKRPNIRINNTFYGCESPIAPYTVQLTNMPMVDMAVLWPVGVDTIQYNSCDSSSLYVRVRNQGMADTTGTKLYYYFDTMALDSTVIAGSIASGATENVLLFRRHMMPGRHTVKVIVSTPGDNIHSNDTIMRSFMVRFCNGDYTIAPTDGDYRSFGEAIDTLNIVGIQGPVVFNVAPGTYTEQVRLNNIPGSSAQNTIGFVGAGNDVLLTAATTQDDNYVMLLDSTSHVTLSKFRIEARPATGNFANALVVQKGDNITIDSMYIKVNGSVNNATASCMVLQGDIDSLTFTGNVLDSGYYAIVSKGLSVGSNIIITGNELKNFLSQGINLRGVTNLVIDGNEIHAGSSTRGLTGLYLAQTSGTFSVQKNKINLIDDKNNGKRGIQLEQISGTSVNPGKVINNMISCSGTGTASLTPAKPSGIWIDSSSTYINVYFNTVRLYCGANANVQYSDNSYAFFSGATVSYIQVMNNIFANLSKGYSYYVSELGTISISDFNDYYTLSSRPIFWKQIRSSLAALQAVNNDDANSVSGVEYEPVFFSEDDLHLVMTNVSDKAQYNPDVPDDIDGEIRHQLNPGPTIGADEIPIELHDMAVTLITEPVMPSNFNFNPPNNMPPHIEGDPVRVIAKFYNNGYSPEDNVQWYAYIEGYETETRTPNKNLGSFNPGESKFDTIMMTTVLGITENNIVHVVVVLPADTVFFNNERTSRFYLAPAFNLAAKQMSTNHAGCNMENTEVRIKIKNEGFKDFPADTPFKIGFHPEITQPSNITVSTMPDTVEEYVTLENPLLMGQSTVVSFPTLANFYPTDNAVDMKFRLMGWVHYDLDITQSNDSTSKTGSGESPIIDSYFTPAAPVGYDTIFPYGTWGEVRASQENSRPIRWYRDTTATSFYHPSQYSTSCKWSNTPQYFSDSIYYLNCFSTKNCPSYFSSVHVEVMPRFQNDMAVEEILAPVGGRVYMENDTVRVRIANYGTSSQSNIMVTYRLKKGNVWEDPVSEICRTTIPAGETYEYTFQSLLNITTPTTEQNYSLLVWTDLSSDASRRNDTISTAKSFRSLPESRYNPSKPGNPSFDITRVSFNEIDFECPPLGRGLTELASPFADPDYPVVHVSRGLNDSLIVQVTPLDATAQTERVKIWVYIDFDRNGIFTSNETLVNGDAFYDNTTFGTTLTISDDASYGYMRMRIAVGSYADFSSGTPSFVNGGIPSDKDGHNMDFLLFVDPNPPATDLAVTQIISPRSYLIRDDQPHAVSFRIANKGTAPVDNPEFSYRFDANVSDSTSTGTITFNGTLQPGTSAVLTIPAHVFPFGVTNLTIWHHTEGDAVPSNDQLQYQYNRFHVIRPVIDDDFDLDNKWYAPVGYNKYSRNLWELGTPNKTRLNAAYSEPNAWVTDLNNTIVTGTRGNVSYLYSPIIYTSVIHPDTISFRLRRHLINNSSLRLEFFNYEGKWVNLNTDSLTNWYNNADDECFDGSTAGNDYNLYWIPANLISGDFNENLQFRFVYTTPIATSSTAAFGEGCAVDNFHVGRARRPIDVGVVDVPYPTAPAYGQTIYPKVVVKNYGTDTIRTLDIAYIHYGTYLPKESHLNCLLPPLATDTFTFTSSFVVSSDFPDTFSITAFTMTQADIYRDNDTCTRRFVLSPLENDISAQSFLYPLDNAVAGDTLQVTLRIRNFGTNPISTATASYIVNGQMRVDEDIDFEAILGRPLRSMEYFNYTFTERFRAPMGVVKLTGIIKSNQNDYIYNDTVTKRVECINSVLDLAAASVIVDTAGFTVVRISLVVENRGARGASGFEVGFYIDDDSSTIYREVYDRVLPALQTGYHSFSTTLPQRSARYNKVTGFVHIPGDNDPTNDTTKTITRQYFDLEMVKTVIVENHEPDCQVVAKVRNNGNIPMLSGQIHVEVYINGDTIKDNFRQNILAGQTVSLVFNRRIPKSPTRRYLGSAVLSFGSDSDPDNNQSNVIEIRGYWEDLEVPVVESNELVLDQNYPNPFEDRTTIPFTLPNDADVRFFVIDAMGHIVNSFTRHYPAGAQTITVDISAYPSGIYYYGIEVNGQRRMKKMILR